MHTLLTDVLTCPRCGPQFGLVLLADLVEHRRVLQGWLGCANCRERFSVTDGFADLRFGADTTVDQPAETLPEDAARVAALLGVTEAGGAVLVSGPVAVHAGVIADMIPGLEVVSVFAPLAAAPERAGVSRLAAGVVLPIRSASMRGVALSGARAGAQISEAARIVAPRGRVVVTSGAADNAQLLAQHGLRLLAQDERMMVAERGAY